MALDLSAITIRELLDPAEPAVRGIMEIYAQAIPAIERKAVEWLIEAIGRADFCLLAAFDGLKPVGFATVFIPERQPFVLLEYLAIEGPYRGRGIGRSLYNAASNRAASRAIVMEVDSIQPALASATEQARRIEFYRRLGARTVAGLSYILPLGDAAAILPPMELMIDNAPESLRLTQLESWLRIIYRDVYQCSEDDPRIARMMPGLRGSDGIVQYAF